MELFQEPYDDRNRRDPVLPSVRSVAEKMDSTILRTRKLLITAGYYSTHMSRWVQELALARKSMDDMMKITGLSRASVNSYLPYKGLAFNLEQTTVNADRHRLFRKRAKAVKALQEHLDLPDAEDYFWEALCAFQGYSFELVDVSEHSAVRFSYRLEKGTLILEKEYIGIDGELISEWFYKMRGKKILSDVIGEYLAEEGRYLMPVLLRLGVSEIV